MSKGWPTKRLGDMTELITKGTTPTSVGYSFVPEGINFVKVESIAADGSFIEEKLAKITQPCHEALKRSQLRAGDILFSIAGALGRTASVTDELLPANTNQALALIRLRKSDDLFAGYVLRALSTGHILEQVEAAKGGVAQLNLSLAQIQDFTIPVPPLPEQKRIVAILDQAFDAIATAKANAERNLQNARALFDSHLQAIFSQRGKGWVEKSLGDIADVQSGGTPTVSQKANWGGTIPWYSSGELNDTFTKAPERHLTEAGLNGSNAKLFPKGSLLVGMYDTAALKMSILDRDGAFNQAIAAIRPNDTIEVEFLLHAINAFKPRLLLERRGVRQKNLSLGKIKEIVIPLPERLEQRATVSRLRGVFDKTQRLESNYRCKLAALDDLKKSLLHHAFSGGL